MDATYIKINFTYYHRMLYAREFFIFLFYFACSFVCIFYSIIVYCCCCCRCWDIAKNLFFYSRYYFVCWIYENVCVFECVQKCAFIYYIYIAIGMLFDNGINWHAHKHTRKLTWSVVNVAAFAIFFFLCVNFARTVTRHT